MAIVKNGTAYRGIRRKKTKPKKMPRDTDRGKANRFVWPTQTLPYSRRVGPRPGPKAYREIAGRKKAPGLQKKKKRRGSGLLWEGGHYKDRTGTRRVFV